jgi:ribonuclease HII
MPWIIGIDEAGYGPNLGPFVMTAPRYAAGPTSGLSRSAST